MSTKHVTNPRAHMVASALVTEASIERCKRMGMRQQKIERFLGSTSTIVDDNATCAQSGLPQASCHPLKVSQTKLSQRPAENNEATECG